ncbi:MAG: T9SS type A sorting domain-containing protein [Bacteroidota bacterium]
MMRNLIPFLVLLGLSFSGFGQTLERTVVGSSGQYSEAADGTSLNFTVGETAVSLLGSGPSAAEGFHRSAVSIVVSTEAPTEDWALRVFPNPTTQWLQVELPEAGEFEAQLNATNGQLLWQSHLQPLSNQINLNKLPAGIYWLRIRNEKGEQQSFKVVKADW